MAVYRLDLAYDGTGFRGYARQDGLRTVQGSLETALATLLGHPVATSVAGRTDAGVHARGQVVSFDHDGDIDTQRVGRGLNGLVGPEMSIRAITIAPAGFNARFSATWRRYRYLIETGPPDPLRRGFVWHVDVGLDIDAMRAAASAFVGEHDFSAFCRSVPGKSNVRDLTSLALEIEDQELAIWAQANSFCHQMVRSMVGQLYDVGRGFSDSADAREVIASGDRGRVATVAPPHGLTLWAVGYEGRLA